MQSTGSTGTLDGIQHCGLLRNWFHLQAEHPASLLQATYNCSRHTVPLLLQSFGSTSTADGVQHGGLLGSGLHLGVGPHLQGGLRAVRNLAGDSEWLRSCRCVPLQYTMHWLARHYAALANVQLRGLHPPCFDGCNSLHLAFVVHFYRACF